MGFGEILRLERERKGFSFKDVSLATRIKKDFIEAFELEDIKAFPSEPFASGFLKNYAFFLGLDKDEIYKLYLENIKSETNDQKASGFEPEEFDASFDYSRLRVVFLYFLGIFLAAAIIFSFYRLVRKNILLPPDKYKANTKFSADNFVKKDYVLEVKASSVCWLQVSADSKIVFSGTLQHGELKRWEADKILNIRVGDINAVKVSLNGKLVDVGKGRRYQNVNSISLTRDTTAYWLIDSQEAYYET